MSVYDTGTDMWRDYKAQYGDTEARGICNRYLDLQVKNTNETELQFCRELFAAMKADLPARKSAIAVLDKAKEAAAASPYAAKTKRCGNHEL